MTEEDIRNLAVEALRRKKEEADEVLAKHKSAHARAISAINDNIDTILTWEAEDNE